MSKTDKPARPRKGGSYTRDPDTGKLKRTQYTRPGQPGPQAAAAAKKAEIAKPADEKGALSDG
jgi:hypothetical protein